MEASEAARQERADKLAGGGAQPEPEPEAAAAAAAAPKGGDPVRKALMEEMKKVKAKWGEQVEVDKGPKGSPWPVAVTRKIPQPETPAAALWDVTVLPIQLCVAGNDFAALPVRVNVPAADFPAPVRQAIAASIARKWKATLKDPRAAGKGWLLDMMFKHAEKQWAALVGSVPECIDSYEAVHEDGSTYRRKVLTAPAEAEEVDEEELERQRLEEEASEMAYLKKMYEQEEAEIAEKERMGEQKRLDAEQGIFMDGEKAVQLGKAGKPMTRKERQGVRTAKTGPRRKKFDPDEHDETRKKKK